MGARLSQNALYAKILGGRPGTDWGAPRAPLQRGGRTWRKLPILPYQKRPPKPTNEETETEVVARTQTTNAQLAQEPKPKRTQRATNTATPIVGSIRNGKDTGVTNDHHTPSNAEETLEEAMDTD